MKRIAIFVAMVALIAACNPYGSEIPREIIGNYTYRGRMLGLYEEFAIYQNDFWDYYTQAVEQSARQYSHERVTYYAEHLDLDWRVAADWDV